MSNSYTSLTPSDIQMAVRRLPLSLANEMRSNPCDVMVGGGYLRSVIMNEPVNDIDIFCPTKRKCQDLAGRLSRANVPFGAPARKVHETENAFTVYDTKPTLQVIHRWTYDNVGQLVDSFDFTVCAAAITFDAGQWRGICVPTYYQDIAARRLVYQCPDRLEEPGGSLLRVLKYYQKGFRIPLDSFSLVIARMLKKGFCNLVAADTILNSPEDYLAKHICGLLREVDPAVDPSHAAHLPTAEDFKQYDEHKGVNTYR